MCLFGLKLFFWMLCFLHTQFPMFSPQDKNGNWTLCSALQPAFIPSKSFRSQLCCYLREACWPALSCSLLSLSAKMNPVENLFNVFSTYLFIFLFFFEKTTYLDLNLVLIFIRLWIWCWRSLFYSFNQENIFLNWFLIFSTTYYDFFRVTVVLLFSRKFTLFILCWNIRCHSPRGCQLHISLACSLSFSQ